MANGPALTTHAEKVKTKEKREKPKQRLNTKKENIGKQQPLLSSPLSLPTKKAPSGHPPPDSGQQVDCLKQKSQQNWRPKKIVK